MATIITHAAIAASIVYIFKPEEKVPAYILSGMVLAILPDLDVVGFLFGIQYGDLWGHRGMTHSILFSVTFSLVWVILVYRFYLYKDKPATYRRYWHLWVIFSLIMISHGLLDMLTNGGLGVALFSPFDTSRYFSPWPFIEVSPIGTHGWSMERFTEIAHTEILYVIVPAAFLAVIGKQIHRHYA